MKKITFTKSTNLLWIPFFLVATFLITNQIFHFLPIEDPKVNKALSIVGYLVPMVYFSRTYWSKNHVEWNEKGVVIRLNSLTGKSFAFDDIRDVTLENGTLGITAMNGITAFDLNGYREEDVKKLFQICTQTFQEA